jgi:hypothetical protein
VAREVLERPWSEADGPDGIRSALETFYSEEEPLDAESRALLEPAIEEIVSIWKRNVYPGMGIRWGTYRSFAGHYGCVRCHDDEHRTREGRAIPLTCETCHVVLAFKEKRPPILEALGFEGD